MHERWGIRLSAADRSEVEAVAANRNGPGARYIRRVPALKRGRAAVK
jgi:hypothetical protein